MTAHSERRQANNWKREKRSQLEAEIRIQLALLRSIRTELAELNKLEGDPLVYRFRWEKPEAVEELFREKREFVTEMEDVWSAGERNLIPKAS